MAMQEERKNPTLTAREHQIIWLVAKGLQDTAISQELGISELTVKSYWGRVKCKRGLCNRTELVAEALRDELDNMKIILASEIDKLREELAKSHEKLVTLQALLNNITRAAVILVDGIGSIEWLNSAAEKMFGYALAEIEGVSVRLLVQPQPQHKNVPLDNLGEFAKSGSNENLYFEAAGLKKSGELFPIYATLAALNNPDGGTIICLSRETDKNEPFIQFAQESSSTFHAP